MKAAPSNDGAAFVRAFCTISLPSFVHKYALKVVNCY
nr:MAG TPA: Ribosome recycling factor [Caudoviricetes sp.]